MVMAYSKEQNKNFNQFHSTIEDQKLDSPNPSSSPE
jgi:hypothetical protein